MPNPVETELTSSSGPKVRLTAVLIGANVVIGIFGFTPRIAVRQSAIKASAERPPGNARIFTKFGPGPSCKIETYTSRGVCSFRLSYFASLATPTISMLFGSVGHQENRWPNGLTPRK